MPMTKFRCSDGSFIQIKECLKKQGCRMKSRCAFIPYLRFISEERPYQGISPSRAGTGPRKILLEQITDYAIDPDQRAWAAFGTATHKKLSIHKFTDNIIAEEPMSDELMRGIPDALMEDEDREGQYILGDYKTWGSFKVAKAKGIFKKTVEILDPKTGKPARFRSGKRVGQVKTRQEIGIDPDKIDLKGEELQLNRYRIFFERAGFPVSKMAVQVITRDGKTMIAYSRGIMNTVYIIPIRRLPDEEVLEFYNDLSVEVNMAFTKGWARKCNDFESWDGRRCEPQWCEVFFACQNMSKKHGEKPDDDRDPHPYGKGK